MCGIFGYVGASRDASEAVLEGLRQLDYRGYDSWGVGVCKEGRIQVTKDSGMIPTRVQVVGGSIGIGHTRWATHGSVTKANAHPHSARDGSFVLAHNGIMENFEPLKMMLIKRGHTFRSETDTEVIVRLIEEKRKGTSTLRKAFQATFKELQGRNTVIVLTREGEILAARNGSPLVLGTAKNGDLYLSSDILSFAKYVDRVHVLDNGELVHIRNGRVALMKALTGIRIEPRFERNAIVGTEVSKGRYAHYMLKEIHEAPFVIEQVLRETDSRIRSCARAIRQARRVYCIGSGTAGASAAQIAYYLRVHGRIPAVGLIGAEAGDYYSLFGKGDLIIAPSQSGETADVLEVLEVARKKGATIVTHVNMPGSMMTRISDFPFMAEAGPEICVMSTKIFVSQIAWGYLIAKAVGGTLEHGRTQLRSLTQALKLFLKDGKRIHDVRRAARAFANHEDVYILGKGQNLQIIKEAMVKMIEGSYIHAHGIPAGDLKHYAITLMEKGVPVIAVVSNDSVQQDVLNAVHEVQARGADVLGITSVSHPLFRTEIRVPDTGETSAIMTIVPLQLLAYFMAAARGNNVDRPRNIAKSVTVK